jgi:uncharacterized membrane protein YbhN (UPF0104 family)
LAIAQINIKSYIYKKEVAMNKSRLIGGIICLALGLFLLVLGFTLDPEKVWLTVNNVSIPGIFLGIVGLALLFTAGWGKKVAN